MDKEKDKKAYAHAEKAYMQGTMFPFIKVGMQKVNLTPTVNIVDGEKVVLFALVAHVASLHHTCSL